MMLKTDRLKFTLFSSIIQLVMIPILYWSLYELASLFHKPYVRLRSSDGMDFYPLMLEYLRVFVVICVVCTNLLQMIIKRETIVFLFHASWVMFIVWFTQGSLLHRPYTYGLVLFCISFTIPTRIIVRKLLYRNAQKGA
jgi:hypothetical protein